MARQRQGFNPEKLKVMKEEIMKMNLIRKAT